jgi:hypothetical protein
MDRCNPLDFIRISYNAIRDIKEIRPAPARGSQDHVGSGNCDQQSGEARGRGHEKQELLSLHGMEHYGIEHYASNRGLVS